MRGLTHALSNRVGTIAAASFLLESQPANVAKVAAMLRDESERLDALLSQMRLLPRRLSQKAEPVVPTDLTGQAIDLQAHHPTFGAIEVRVVLDGDLQPGYADPSALVLALTLVIGAAQRLNAAPDPIAITIRSDTESVIFESTALTFHDDAVALRGDNVLDLQAAHWLLHASGGRADATDAGGAVRIPTLQAARRAPRG
ncbi:MAG: hypothetical protein IT353_11575 [Gemmatimonadaceae bacterium]|nr:hypothetical protein [Gemmatimonadaceae bacterium]